MTQLVVDSIVSVLNTLYLVFALGISLAYTALAVVSLFALNRYLKKARATDFKSILTSPLAPGISMLAPAYNEGLTIIDNVRSLLSIMYNNLEVIIINDGSKDDTLDKLIDTFQLVKVPAHVEQWLSTKSILGVYKSENRAFRKLTVVDKQNGGKADALNVGINVSSKELVACIDVDCIIERDALLKMVMPIVESAVPVIAVGGVVRIANDCNIEEGRLGKVRLSGKQVVKFQTLEYIRAFLIGRMAWTKLNGLLLISGAFGLFRKDIAVKAGGYNTATVGEDMELVVRMRAYMHQQKTPYKVEYIPEPLCWTEAPADYKILARQRNRWTRGTFETLKLHRYLFLNPVYGLMGLVSYPFWLFFEWLAPLVEFSGLLFMIILMAFGKINIMLAVALMLALYSFSVFISMTALLAEEFSYYQYKRKRDIMNLALTAFIEPIVFHPRVVWWAIQGNIDLLKGKKNWGEMPRQGFTSQSSCEPMKNPGITTAFLWLLMLSPITTVFSQPVDQVFNTKATFQQAREHAFGGKRVEARELLRLLLYNDPENLDARMLLARTYAWEGSFSEARHELDFVFAHAPINEEALNFSVDISTWSKEYDRGLLEVDKALTYYTDSQDLLVKKAQLCVSLLDFEAARETVDRLLLLNPRHPEGVEIKRDLQERLLRSEISISSAVDLFSRTYNPAYYYFVQLSQRSSVGLGTIRINCSSRFEKVGFQPEIELYPVFSKKAYAYVNVGYSESALFPKHRLGAELYAKIFKATEASFGVRHLDFGPSNKVWMYTSSVGWYKGRYLLLIRPTIVSSHDLTTSSIVLSIRKYFRDEKSYIGLLVGMGLLPDERRLQTSGASDPAGNYTLKSKSAGGTWQKHLSRHFTARVNYELTYRELTRGSSEFAWINAVQVSVNRKF